MRHVGGGMDGDVRRCTGFFHPFLTLGDSITVTISRQYAVSGGVACLGYAAFNRGGYRV